MKKKDFVTLIMSVVGGIVLLLCLIPVIGGLK